MFNALCLTMPCFVPTVHLHLQLESLKQEKEALSRQAIKLASELDTAQQRSAGLKEELEEAKAAAAEVSLGPGRAGMVARQGGALCRRWARWRAVPPLQACT